ncbi:MAG: hypothetical protein J6T10_11325 [Methanobrevibacter sp.]|nr:hypothetical protein [Methanobrevibacter sp.]
MNLLIGNYNNYFNRIVKSEESYADYVTAMGTTYKRIDDFNFNPNDGINTEFVLGKGDYTDSPDYLVVFNEETNNNVTTQTIISRWFVLDMHRTRGGQYKFSLRRDVIADNLDEVLNAPTYIEKGQVNAGSPFVFNKEGMILNQIKISEDQLVDNSKCAWLVGYVAKNATASNVTINYAPSDQNVVKVSASSIDNWFQSLGINPGQPFLAEPYDISYRTAWQAGTGFVYHYACRTYIYGTGSFSSEDDHRGSGNDAIRAGWYADRNEVGNALLNAYNTLGLSSLKAALISLVGSHSGAEVTSIKNFNGKTIKTTDGKYYRISVVTAPTYEVKNASLVSGNSLYTLMTSALTLAQVFGQYTTPDSSSFKYSFKCSQYIVTASEDTSASVKVNLNSTRVKTNDSLFDIIAMPYAPGNNTAKVTISGGSTIYVNNKVSMAAMTALATTLVPGQGIYDIQLLPYCPIQNYINSTGGLLVDSTREGADFDWIVDGSNSDAKIGIMFYCPESQFTFDINKSLYWNQFRVIDDFTPLSEMPSPYNNFQPNVSYVLTSAIYQLPFAQCTIDTGYYNKITFNKINKRTGEVIETMQGSSITITPSLSTYATIGCSYCPIEGVQGWTTPWNWGSGALGNPYLPYDLDDVYLEIIINTSNFNVTLPSYVKQLVQQPIFSSEMNGVVAMKVDNECNLYRLVSPNYQGEFEFSPVKNGGVDRFNVDCTYKPYNPYIHVNPDFGGLYGDDYNDSRGLICQGDFTVGMISDAFQTYELNNKNYQQIFNRQIQNMDISNEIARQEQGVKSVTGAITGTVTGAVGGGIATGSPYGAIAGGIIGAGTGIAGGIADYYNLDRQLKENKSFTADMYNFSLQNIKALPYTLTRCTALTFNNKLFPFIEKYSCTDNEKEAFIKKLTYDGMTVNAVATIADYTDRNNRLVRGQVIRLPGLKDDDHMANEIYNEIKKGVYI